MIRQRALLVGRLMLLLRQCKKRWLDLSGHSIERGRGWRTDCSVEGGYAFIRVSSPSFPPKPLIASYKAMIVAHIVCTKNYASAFWMPKTVTSTWLCVPRSMRG